jgi:hypothetical protein
LIKKNLTSLKLNAMPIRLLLHDHLALTNGEVATITHVLVVVTKDVAPTQAIEFNLNVNLQNTRDPI